MNYFKIWFSLYLKKIVGYNLFFISTLLSLQEKDLSYWQRELAHAYQEAAVAKDSKSFFEGERKIQMVQEQLLLLRREIINSTVANQFYRNEKSFNSL